ncbi:MAG: hypothetical protein LRZ94_01125 [Candidatus Pacebacteria bacterium]|nr:hypothetical protein [Candidatus Paceibacterota bacterium]
MKNNSLKNFIKETEKRFDKKFMSTQIDEGYIEIEENEKLREELKSFITNHQIELLELVIKKIEGQEKNNMACNDVEKAKTPNIIRMLGKQYGYNQCRKNITQIIKKAIEHYENHTQK